MSKKLTLFSISSLILTIFTSIELALAEAKISASDLTSTTYQYPSDYVQNYTQNCIRTSMEEGLSEEDARTLCDCTLDRFQKKYSLSEFKQLTLDSQTDENAANSLIEVGELCFESILFE
ncbi:MAG: hypothetical protein AB4368_22965 [Xenococcaceae cyanobacterium]